MKFDLAKDSAFKQLFFFLAMIFVSGFLFTFLGTVIAVLLEGGNVIETLLQGADFTTLQMKIIQASSHIGLFLVPSLLYAYLSGKGIWTYLHIKSLPAYTMILMSIMLLVLSIPLIALLNEWNMAMKLPAFMSGLENWMKNMEEQAREATLSFLSTDRPIIYISNLLVFALLPALGEELVFRGVLMQIFSRFMKNIHLNILFTAFLFSALHLQFYGFIPRFAIGIMLGYLLVWSGSLLLPMLFHFLFNSTTITAYYLFHSNAIEQNPDELGITHKLAYLGLNVALLLIIFWWFKRRSVGPIMEMKESLRPRD